MLPSVVDYGEDNYIITASMYDGTELPSWINFDSKKFSFTLPKGASPSKPSILYFALASNYDIKVQINDENGLYSSYKLEVNVKTTQLHLNSISNSELVSPQGVQYTYAQILADSYNYDLNSSISLVFTENIIDPYWITETKTDYKCVINTEFNPKETLEYHARFEVTDYCGDKYYTNEFKLTIYPNRAPVLNYKLPNATFYKGQEDVKIQTPSNMFTDPGDTILIYTTY